MWKFKEYLTPYIISDNFWYDITDGGYLKPEKMLQDEKQIIMLREAINIVKSFENTLEDKNLISEDFPIL
jgi:hypothetical protein